MRLRDSLVLFGALPFASTAAKRVGTFDWTAVLVALIGLTGIVTAAFLARSARRTESAPTSAAELLRSWQEVVVGLRDELDRMTRDRDRQAEHAEEAIGRRNLALAELRACQRHDHGDVT